MSGALADLLGPQHAVLATDQDAAELTISCWQDP